MAPDDIDALLTGLVEQSPPGRERLVGLLRSTCAGVLSLPPLPSDIVVAQPESAEEAVIADFAAQFSVDVAGISDEQRAALGAAAGRATFPVVVQMFLADFLPRARAGLTALGQPAAWVPDRPAWQADADASELVFTGLLPAVARLRELDPLTTEVVRLRGAVAHDCRLCKSLREGSALDAGGSETLYSDIGSFEDSPLLSDAHKAALRYADALIWSPGRIEPAIVAAVREHFSPGQARELTLDVMRNASNKIAVALKGDAPRVEHGTERYSIDADGQTVFG